MNLMRAWECDGQFSLLLVMREYCTPDSGNAYFRKCLSEDLVYLEKMAKGSCGNQVQKGVVVASEPLWCEGKGKNIFVFL